MRKGLEDGKLSLLLRGEKVKGSFALVRTKDAKTWLLIKHKDRFVAKGDLTERDRSVLSGVTVEEMTAVPVQRIPAERLVPGGEKRSMPDKLSPMHAEIGDAAFNNPDWMWEPKLDGYRALAFIDGEGVKLRSRRGLELGEDFPRLVAELGKQDVNGAWCSTARSSPSTRAASRRSARCRIATAAPSARSSTAFDLLYFAGADLRKAIYADRRRYLAQCLLPSPWYSSCMPKRMAWLCTRRRWRADSRA